MTERTRLSYAAEILAYAVLALAFMLLTGCESQPEWPATDAQITIDDAGVQSGDSDPATAPADTPNAMPPIADGYSDSKSEPSPDGFEAIATKRPGCPGGNCSSGQSRPRLFRRR